MDPRLRRLAAALPRPLTVVDVGCRWGTQPVWLDLPQVRVIGFDPDEEECRRLTEQAGGNPSVRFVPVALGAEAGPAPLYVTREPACSSLYPPDSDLIATRPSLVVITPEAEIEVALQTLHAWAAAENIDRVDHLKLDTQGSELDILRGAERTLATVRAVEVEVEFNPIYQGQPLFGDVDGFLRGHGFVLWRLANLAHYHLPGDLSDFATSETHYFDLRHHPTFPGTGGQLYWANASYVRAEMAFPPASVPWEMALADTVLTTALGFHDLARQSAARASGAPPAVAELLRRLAAGEPAPA